MSGAPAGDLDGLINLLASTSSIARLLIPVCLGSPEAKSGKNTSAKSIFGGDIRRSLLGDQASYLWSMERVDICINHPSGYSGWLYMFEPTVVLVDFHPLGFVTKLTAYW